MSIPTSLIFAALVLLTPISTLAKLSLGAAAVNCGVCAAQTVTNLGATVITCSLGLGLGSSITGFPPGTATKIEIGSTAAIESKSQAAQTYATWVALLTNVDLSGQPLGGCTLFPGYTTLPLPPPLPANWISTPYLTRVAIYLQNRHGTYRCSTIQRGSRRSCNCLECLFLRR